MWCRKNFLISETLMTRTGKSMDRRADTPASVRASISFPPDVHQILEEMAREKKVSLAWIVREAAERYIRDRMPLFREME